jgi:hypothetical protein
MELAEDSPHSTGAISHPNGLKGYLICLASQWLMMALFGWAFRTSSSAIDLFISAEFSMRIFGKSMAQSLVLGMENQPLDCQLKNFQLRKCRKIHIMALKLPKNQLFFYS